MSAFTSVLGDKLMKGKEAVPTADALAGKVAVGLYFSAHWCPPCRQFTPMLGKMYTDAFKAKGLEIIFVSSDKTEEAFDDYYGTQPWLALPYADRELKAKLSKKYKVNGIPTLVILGPDGELITADGREAVMEDPTGAQLPWKPPSFWDALGTEFLSGTDGDTVDLDEIKGEGKIIGLYFSAHWCPPCRGFTPSLVSAYNDHLKAKNLEIIFVSSDRDNASFMEYYGTMPWLAIPNGDKRKNALSKRFGVQGIPAFVLVDGATGETITTNGRGEVGGDPTGVAFPWHPKALADLAKGPLDPLNEETCLIALMEGCDAAAVAAAEAVLTPIAEASKAKGDPTCFFLAKSAEGPVEQIRQMTKLGDAKAGAVSIILLDIPDNGGYYTCDATAVTAEAVTGFLAAYEAKTLTRKQLG